MFQQLQSNKHDKRLERMKVWQETEGISKRMPPPPEPIKHTLRPDKRPQRRFDATDIQVTREDTIDAARRLLEGGFGPMVLNLADDCFAGGCVDTGAGAQEESLFRRSNYCMSLHNDPRRARLYPIAHNEAVYSPGITVFRSSEGSDYRFLPQAFKLSFIACPGLKCPELIFDSAKEKEKGRLSEADLSILENKIRLILQVGANEGHDSLVLGALGCGAWRNPPADVASVFERVLSAHQGVFRVIVFAILSVTEFDGDNYSIFRDRFLSSASSHSQSSSGQRLCPA
jgi:uncharacterized protein (TIGR02452 family)